MTVQELFNHAHKLGFLDDEVDEVASYVKFLGSDEQCRGTCGACANRKTDFCPWPQSSKLMDPICCSFKEKKPEPEMIITPEQAERIKEQIKQFEERRKRDANFAINLGGRCTPGMLMYNK